MDKELALVSVLEIIGDFWSLAIVTIYILAAIWFIKLYPHLKGIGSYKFEIKFIVVLCVAMAIAFLVNLILSFSNTQITIATVFVVVVIRPLIFLAGCALASLAHAGECLFKHLI